MIWQPEDLQVQKIKTRACLKKAFRELRVPVCGRFYPNKGGVAGYVNRMRVKYTAKWGSQIAEMIFQDGSIGYLSEPMLPFLHFAFQQDAMSANDEWRS